MGMRTVKGCYSKWVKKAKVEISSGPKSTTCEKVENVLIFD